MTHKIKFRFCSLLFFNLVVTIISSSNLFAQQRNDEVLPKIIGSVKTISNLTGWAKDDIGKWYQFNTFKLGREQILKIEFAKIRYQDKDFFCIASFGRHAYLRANVTNLEYFANFFLFDSTKKQVLTFSDTSVHTIVFDSTFISDNVIKTRPITWADMIVQIKRCLSNTTCTSTEEIFFLKYRYDYKLNKSQFYVGGIVDYSKYSGNANEKYNDFTDLKFSPFEGCKDKNQNLECGYYEVYKNFFDICFQEILK